MNPTPESLPLTKQDIDERLWNIKSHLEALHEFAMGNLSFDQIGQNPMSEIEGYSKEAWDWCCEIEAYLSRPSPVPNEHSQEGVLERVALAIRREYIDITGKSFLPKTSIRLAKAALAATPKHIDGWQDISSAPKDGTKIRLKDENEKEIVGFWSKHWKIWGDGIREFWPTHWLPAPPTVKSEGA